MSHTLLMRLVAPMQSWGVQSDFTHRDTGPEPSKSGVVGLLCAALGRDRSESISDLSALRMGVRVDREGLLKRDYHTAQDVRKASAKSMQDTKGTEVSERFYLADAAFLAGLEGDDLNLLRHLDAALRHPHWFIFLGRKAFVPSEPVWVENGVREGQALEESLRDLLTFPRRAPYHKEDDARMRLVLEVKPGEHGEITRRDQPVSFVKGQRQFDTRQMRVDFCDDQPILKQET